MTTMQVKTISRIKNGFSGFTNGKSVITIQGIIDLLPEEDPKTILKDITNWEGIKLVGNSLDGLIEISEECFNDNSEIDNLNRNDERTRS